MCVNRNLIVFQCSLRMLVMICLVFLAAGVQVSQYEEQFVQLFTLAMTQLKEVLYFLNSLPEVSSYSHASQSYFACYLVSALQNKYFN